MGGRRNYKVKRSIVFGITAILACVGVTLSTVYQDYMILALALQGIFTIASMVALVQEIRNGEW